MDVENWAAQHRLPPQMLACPHDCSVRSGSLVEDRLE
jgi:hypothetical protein